MTGRLSPLIAVLLLIISASMPGSASAHWSGASAGSGYSKADALSPGATPTATASGRDVTLAWAASGGPVPIGGYVIRRYDGGGQAQAVGSGCAGTISALSCTEQAVPPGQWRYAVTPANGNWRGAESAQSATVTVAAPALSLAPATVSSLPAVVSGQVSGFAGGQTVTFRLDDPKTGTILAGNISPSPVPAGGTASASVTIPAGTSNGVHTVYAVGSGGDVASATITVAAPVTTTIATSAWDLRDASAGGAEVNQSDASAFAGDGRSATSGNFSAAFSAARYLQYAYDGALGPGLSTSSMAFNLSYAGTGAGDTTCFYFDVRRISTGAVVGTHGSSAAPVSCTTGTAFKATSTPMPEVATSDLANDLQVRIYASSSGNRPLNVDLATVSGTASGQAFTLYESSSINAATGTPGAAVPWSLYASDSAFYASASNWATSFASTRYLKMTFPAYVPSGATIDAAIFDHAYRSANNGASVCYYLEAYSGSTLIGTHGSAAAPISCNSSNSTAQVDSISLPEVTTAAAANALMLKLYVNRNNAGKSRHDLAQLQVTFTR